MAKDKKKHSKKDQLSSNILDVAALSIKKFRKVTKQIGKLSTGQKVAGGLTLLAAGLTYVANQPTAAKASANPPTPSSEEDTAAETAGTKTPARRGKKASDA